jgi:hypothetical protein
MSDFWGLRHKPEAGTEVRFLMPVEGKNKGFVYKIDGSYCYIHVKGPFLKSEDEFITIERYWESELQLIES